MQIEETENGAKVGDDVEFIWARNSKEFLFSNSILIHGDKPIIVDPSASFTYIEQLAKSRYVRMVLNTHKHGDHRSLNQLFKETVFASHEDDAASISDFNDYAREADSDQNSYYIQWMRDIFKKYKIIDCPVSLKFKDGDILSTGSEEIEIIHLPGHTPGHVGLFFKKTDLLFVADIDLTPYGPWYAGVFSDINKFRKSCERVKNIECTWYVPSHGERIYDREKFLEKMARYEGFFDEREQKILEFLKAEPRDQLALSQHGIIYRQGSLSDPLKYYFQFKMIGKHLDDLAARGLIHQDGDVWVAA